MAIMAVTSDSKHTNPVMRNRSARIKLGLIAGGPPERRAANTVLECLGGRPILSYLFPLIVDDGGWHTIKGVSQSRIDTGEGAIG